MSSSDSCESFGRLVRYGISSQLGVSGMLWESNKDTLASKLSQFCTMRNLEAVCLGVVISAISGCYLV